jgi:hypothetical protein
MNNTYCKNDLCNTERSTRDGCIILITNLLKNSEATEADKVYNQAIRDAMNEIEKYYGKYFSYEGKLHREK